MFRKYFIIIIGLFHPKSELPKIRFLGDYIIEGAKLSDVDFIYNRIVEEADAGYFSDRFSDDELKNGICDQILCTTQLRKTPDSKGIRNGSVLSIVKHNNISIGFVWCREIREESDGGWELYLTSFAPEHRGKGLGGMSVSYMLNLIHSEFDIYARVYRNRPNKPMVHILKSLGFKACSARNTYLDTTIYKKSALKARSPASVSY